MYDLDTIYYYVYKKIIFSYFREKFIDTKVVFSIIEKSEK